MHDVGIALDGHELVHLHRAHPGHPAHVVAPEVHQHDVLGALLRVGQQILLQLPLFLRVAAPGPGAGDGPKLDVLAGEADEDLRGGADDLEVVQLQEEHVGRRVGEPQGAVDLERLDLGARLQPLGQHHLDDVAGGDVLLALAHHGVELLRRDVGFVSDGRSRTVEAPGFQGLGRLPQGRAQVLDAGDGVAVEDPRARALVDGDVVDDRDGVLEVVEAHQRAHQQEVDVRETAGPFGRVGNPVQHLHRIVRHVAESAPGEREVRQAGGRAVSFEDLGQRPQRVVAGPRLRLPSSGDLDIASPGLEHQFRRGAQERVARPALAALHALQQERVTALPETVVEGHRGFEVHEDLLVNRHHVPLSGKLRELAVRRLDHGTLA